MKIALIIIGIIIFIALVLFIVGFIVANVAFKANRHPGNIDERIVDKNCSLIVNHEFDDPKRYKTLHIESDDGLLLFAHYLKCEQQTHKYMILFHGYHGTPFFSSNLISKCYEAGYNVVLINQRGHGESQGNYISMGALEAQDGIKWIDHICDLDPKAQICLHGHSMGGHIVMLLAGSNLRSNVKCVIEDCGYTNLFDQLLFVGKDFYKIPLSKFFLKIAMIISRVFYKVKNTDVKEGLSKSYIPICFIHGEEDNFVPVSNATEAYEITKTKEKELHIFKDAMHCTSESHEPQKYYDIFLSFMNKYIK